jgi:hypothetical protein
MDERNQIPWDAEQQNLTFDTSTCVSYFRIHKVTELRTITAMEVPEQFVISFTLGTYEVTTPWRKNCLEVLVHNMNLRASVLQSESNDTMCEATMKEIMLKIEVNCDLGC